jgi:hypothetical protein
MKFYKEDPDYDEIYYEIISNKFTAIISSKNLATNDSCVYFFKKGLLHNNKNAAYIDEKKRQQFCLNDKCYGHKDDFAKESWRRFVKMQAFI